MSEEEIMQGINTIIAFMKEELKAEHSCFTIKELWAIQGLLDLYKQEKEKNNNLIKQLQEQNTEIQDISRQLRQEKEKNKELKKYEEAYKLLSYALNNYISKDKIKEKIEELVEQGDYRTEENPNGRIHFHKEPVDYQLEILKELLKEV